MKRVWAAGIMLAVVLGISLTGLIFSNHAINSMRSEIEEAQTSLSQNELETAKQHSDTLIELWQGHYSLMCTYISHDKLEQVDQSISVLTTHFAYEEYQQFAGELSRAYSQLEHLKDTEFPKLENIL